MSATFCSAVARLMCVCVCEHSTYYTCICTLYRHKYVCIVLCQPSICGMYVCVSTHAHKHISTTPYTHNPQRRVTGMHHGWSPSMLPLPSRYQNFGNIHRYQRYVYDLIPWNFASLTSQVSYHMYTSVCAGMLHILVRNVSS